MYITWLYSDSIAIGFISGASEQTSWTWQACQSHWEIQSTDIWLILSDLATVETVEGRNVLPFRHQAQPSMVMKPGHSMKNYAKIKCQVTKWVLVWGKGNVAQDTNGDMRKGHATEPLICVKFRVKLIWLKMFLPLAMLVLIIMIEQSAVSKMRQVLLLKSLHQVPAVLQDQQVDITLMPWTKVKSSVRGFRTTENQSCWGWHRMETMRVWKNYFRWARMSTAWTDLAGQLPCQQPLKAMLMFSRP